jgi:hypothetical protein
MRLPPASLSTSSAVLSFHSVLRVWLELCARIRILYKGVNLREAGAARADRLRAQRRRFSDSARAAQRAALSRVQSGPHHLEAIRDSRCYRRQRSRRFGLGVLVDRIRTRDLRVMASPQITHTSSSRSSRPTRAAAR